jgi:hypothetical protein
VIRSGLELVGDQVAEQLKRAIGIYRTALERFAKRLSKLGALRPDLDVDDTVDRLWFYFGYSSLFTLHDDNGWSYERAERWLAAQACRELLQSGT